MTDEQTPALEAGDEVVQPEVTETEAPEEVESTEGQDDNQPADDDSEDKPEEKPEEKTKSQIRRERRKAEAERIRAESETLKTELDRANARLRRIDEAAQATQPPKEEDFKDWEEYQAARYAHASIQALDGRQRKEVENEVSEHQSKLNETEQRRRNEVAQNWADQVADAKTRYADFATVFSDDVPVTADGAEIIADSDMGADIAYWLGSNRTEAARIAKLPPLKQAVEIGRIEARLSLPRSKTVTTAPEPIAPVRGKATASKDPDKMSPAEYRKWREKGGSL